MKAISKTNLDDIKTKVKEVVANLLNDKSDSLDLDKSFLDLGINSVLAVELVEAVNQRLGIKLGIEVIFDYRGINELAKHILNQYGEECQAKEEINNHRASFVEERDSDIAIIGVSGKFAGSETIQEFWGHLQAGISCIEEINRKGWEENRYYDPNPAQKNKSISKWGGLLKNIDKFDALFFNISPLEAEKIDHKKRLLLE